MKIPFISKGSKNVIPLVRLVGTIATGGGRQKNLNLAGVEEALEKAFEMEKAPAVALSINSPGGSPVQSHLIYRKIRYLSKQHNKPVLAFVEDVAASGGYMIAIAGDEIIADESSIIGSIGVVMASFGFDKLIKEYGVDRRVYTAGKNKVTLDPFLPEDEKAVEHLKTLQLDIHAHFIDLVEMRRRKLVDPDENEIFTGKFWTGRPAKQLGLIDGIGSLEESIKNRFGEKAKIKLMNPPKKSPFDLLSSKLEPADIANGITEALEGYALKKGAGL